MKKKILIGAGLVAIIATGLTLFTQREADYEVVDDAFYLGEQVVTILKGDKTGDLSKYSKGIQDYLNTIVINLEDEYPDYVNVTAMNEMYSANYGVVNSDSVQDDDIDETEMTEEEIKAILGEDYTERIDGEDEVLPNDSRLIEIKGNMVVKHEDLVFNDKGEDFVTLDGVTHLINEAVLETSYKTIIGKQDYNFVYNTHSVYEDKNNSYIDILYNSITNKNRLSVRVYYTKDIDRMDVKLIEG